MTKKYSLTDKMLQTLKEMVCGIELYSDIKDEDQEWLYLKRRKLENEYNELLKTMDDTSIAEIVRSRTIYDDTETLIERIKALHNVEITDKNVLEQLNKLQEKIDKKEKKIDEMYEDLRDLKAYEAKQHMKK